MSGAEVGQEPHRQLLEREEQLVELRRHLDLARQGAGRLVLVGGSAGIGKSALVREFCRRFASDARVLAGACDALSTQLPLAPLFDLQSALGAQGARLVSDNEGRLARFRTFLELLSAPGRPVLVVFEDVHWADEATLDLLRFTGRRIGGTSSMLIVTYRNDEIGSTHPLRIVFGDIATYGTSHRVTLAPLSIEALATLAEGTRIDAGELQRLTGGNPFYATEVLAAGGDVLPPSVRDAVLARAARLSGRSRAALDMAAILGSPGERAILERCLDESPHAIDACVESGMLLVEGALYSFRHEIARQAILSVMTPQQRSALHLRALEALESAGVDQTKLARLAHHAEGSGQERAVLRYAPAAARESARLNAHREAANQLARALRFATRLDPDEQAMLHEEFARECLLTDRLDEAIEARRRALEIWRARGVALKEGENLYHLARALVLSGQNTDAEEASRAAIRVLEQEPPGPELASAYQIQAHLRMLNRDNAQAVERGMQAIELAERTEAREALIYAHNSVGSALMFSDAQRGREMLERSASMAREAGLDAYVAAAFSNLGTASGEIYTFDLAARYLDEGIAFCAERDFDLEMSYMRSWRALTHMFQGHWSAATAEATSLLRLPRLSAISEIMSRVAIGRVRARRGDPEAGEMLDRALEIASQTATLQRLGPVHAARAEAAWLGGDHERVREEARAVYDLAIRQEHPWHIGELSYWRWKTGDLDAVPGGAAEPFALQMAGDWSTAAASWDALGCPYEAARALAESDEEAALREAFERFDALGAIPARSTVAQRLRELGAQAVPRGARPSTLANPAQLTQRQIQVAELIAGGYTNAEIAERLFISPKTVEHHVTALFAKLGVGSRVEATRELIRLGVTSTK